MAQNSKPRHSRTTKKPVTIDLEADAVKSDKDVQAKTEPPAEKKSDASATAAKVKSTPHVKPAASGGSSKKAEETQKPAQPAAAASAGSAAASTAKPSAVAVGKEAGKAAGTGEKTGKPGESAPGGAISSSASTAKQENKSAKVTDTGGKQPSSGQASAAASQKSSGRGGGAGGLLAGLIGGVVALVLAGALQWAGVLPGLKSESGSVSASDLAQIRESVTALENRAGSDVSSVTDSLDTRIKSLEDKASAPTPDSGTIADLDKRVSDLASKVGAAGAAAPDEAMTSKLADLEKTQADLQAALDQAGTRISGLSTRIDTLGQDQKTAIAGLDAKIASIEKSLAGPREDIKVARALAAAGLKSAIDRGGSFMAELEAYASVEGTGPAVDQLRTLAARGVPTQAQLLSRFSSDAGSIIQAAEGGASEEGVFTRLLDSASSLVKVRPVGEISGDSPEAIVARLENRLKNGNLQGAVDEWNTLPKAAQDAYSGFIDGLKARILADKLVAGMLTDAMPAAPAATPAAPAEGGKN